MPQTEAAPLTWRGFSFLSRGLLSECLNFSDYQPYKNNSGVCVKAPDRAEGSRSRDKT
jgi:hypothetical protein